MVIPSIGGDKDMKFELKREGGTLTVERQGASKPWQLLLVGIKSVKPADGATEESTPIGTLVTPTIGANHLRISLASSG